jgi:hypothetical protein
MHVRFVAKVGVSILAMLLTALPVLACAAPGTAMTRAEHDCCKRMAQECGKGKMPQSHSCCKTVAMPDRLPAIKSASAFSSDQPSFDPAYALPQIPPVMIVTERASAICASDMHGPLGSPPSSIFILRI